MATNQQIQRPTILLVITKGDVGGAQIHCLDIMRHLKTQYQFVLVCGEKDFLTRSADDLGVEVKIIPSLKRPISPKQDWAAFRMLRTTISELKPDLVHAHSSKAGVLARLAAFSRRVPAIFTAHGWAFTEGAPRKQRCLGLFIEWALGCITTKTIAVSRYDYALALRYRVANKGRMHLIQNGVEATKIRERAPTLRPRIITVGRLTSVKNQYFIIECLAALKFDFSAKIIGSGDQYARLKAQICKHQLEDKVELTLNIEDVTEFLTDSDIFILGSLYEGLPLSVLEAMSVKLPVISTDVGGVSEAVIDGETGFLVPRNDKKLFVEKLELLIADKERRIMMGEAGYKHFQQHFTAQRMVNQTNEVYQEVLKRP